MTAPQTPGRYLSWMLTVIRCVRMGHPGSVQSIWQAMWNKTTTIWIFRSSQGFSATLPYRGRWQSDETMKKYSDLIHTLRTCGGSHQIQTCMALF